MWHKCNFPQCSIAHVFQPLFISDLNVEQGGCFEEGTKSMLWMLKIFISLLYKDKDKEINKDKDIDKDKDKV